MNTAHEQYKKGNELRALGRDKEALLAYESALSIQPDFLIAKKCADFLRSHLEKKCLSFGRLYESEGNISEACTEYTRALEIDPRSVPAHKHLALLYMHSGEFTHAKSHIHAALEIHPSQGILYFYLGQICDHEERHADAVDAYTHAQRYMAHNKEIARHKRLSARLSDLYTHAHGPTPSPEIALDIASVYLEKDMPEVAIGVLERIIRLHARAEGLIYTLANIYFSQDEFQKALDRYKKCRAISRGSIADEEVCYKIGLCYLNLDKRPTAREAFEKCLCLCPTSRSALRAKAELANIEKTGQLTFF